MDMVRYNHLPPILADNVRAQRFPDERFFYVEKAEKSGYYRLQLVNQNGRYNSSAGAWC